MDKNTLIGIVLIGLIFIAFMFVNQKEQEAIERANQAQQTSTQENEIISNSSIVNSSDTITNDFNDVIFEDNLENADSISGLSAVQLARRKQKFGIFHPALEGEKKYSYLENDKIKIKFSNIGARIVEVFLVQKDENGNYIYKTHTDFVNNQNNPIQLFEEQTSNQELKETPGVLAP